MKTDKKLIDYRRAGSLRKQANKANKTIVFTTGCYDILHLGHVINLNYCKKLGDYLVVMVGSDENVRMLKGPNRPINNELLRARLLAALEVVDYVLISEEKGKIDHKVFLEILKPDFYVVPGNDSAITEREILINKVGGKLIKTKRVPPRTGKGISTSLIEKKLLEE